MSVGRIVRRVEACCIALATGGAVSGLHGFTFAGLPIDRAGMYADIGAGAFALGHWAHHRRTHRRE